MIFRWTPYPMVRLAIYLGAGICYARFAHPELQLIEYILLATFTGTFYLLIYKKYKLTSGIVAAILIFYCGALIVTNHKDNQSANHLTRLNNSILGFQGIVYNNIEKTRSGYKTKIRIVKVRDSVGWTNYFSDCLVYFKTLPADLNANTYILGVGSPSKIIPDSESRYAEQLIDKNIYYQFFARKNNFRILSKNQNPSTDKIQAIKSNILKLTANYISGADERAITEALLIGKTDGLSATLRSAYAASGTMHVLAVSGLHVGIIYWILLIILKPLTTLAQGRWLIALISIFILWSYAALTGFSPSVLRAVAMFTFVAISNPFGLRSRIVNTLAASFFILLIYDPGMISNIGFQLSYLAVAGIIWINPVLHKKFQSENRVLNYCWSIISVSIAAQLTTFPLTVYYFHQFPVYFIPANLIIIPLSFLILLVGMTLLALGQITALAALLGYIIQQGIGFMNSIARTFQTLPGQLPNHIQLSVAQAFILMALNLLIISMIMYRKNLIMVPAMILALIFAGIDFCS